MNRTTHDDHEQRLSRLLRTWKVDPSDDPRLATKVWARIDPGRVATTARTTTPRWVEELVAVFAKPFVAFAAVAVFAAGGAGLAYMQNSRMHEARFDRLVREYVYSIDPVKMHPSDGSAAGAATPLHDHGHTQGDPRS
ncbi:hypothetical protein ASA1KI_14080 [Opitutales bacterium ASA1]|uniref:hypothetical protein n=1 Tax=Congregicoccus parvus TaxID=3081749 RepID=UPI002B2FE224|nr:hypothetical protein ASA1KI_14080 [Opitutales bacterium ASA1]